MLVVGKPRPDSRRRKSIGSTKRPSSVSSSRPHSPKLFGQEIFRKQQKIIKPNSAQEENESLMNKRTKNRVTGNSILKS